MDNISNSGIVVKQVFPTAPFTPSNKQLKCKYQIKRTDTISVEAVLPFLLLPMPVEIFLYKNIEPLLFYLRIDLILNSLFVRKERTTTKNHESHKNVLAS